MTRIELSKASIDSTKAGGTGTGLTLARQIAEAHDGVITLANRSAPERGTIARLRLPAHG